MASIFAEMVALKETAPGSGIYNSTHLPERMGNALPIAYGGCALGCGVKAAYLSLPPADKSGKTYSLYSAQGSYLGPASTEKHFTITTRALRTTKSFATRSVEVSQEQKDGSLRVCLVILADFQLPDQSAVLAFSKPPSMRYSGVDECLHADVHRQKMVDSGAVQTGLAKAHATTFGLVARFFEQRPCPEGVSAQTLSGMAKKIGTTQKGWELHEKGSADWMRNREKLGGNEGDQGAAMAFLMDAALAFMPLTHSGMFLDDAGACSSLVSSCARLVVVTI